MNNLEKYLPIGTVVLLKEGTKRIMITGFCCVADDNKDKVFDYCGCVYPEGNISSKETLLFDHVQIEKVYHLGLVDEEEKKFKENLNKMIIQMQKENNQTENI